LRGWFTLRPRKYAGCPSQRIQVEKLGAVQSSSITRKFHSLSRLLIDLIFHYQDIWSRLS
jgi:hypothetical protein